MLSRSVKGAKFKAAPRVWCGFRRNSWEDSSIGRSKLAAQTPEVWEDNFKSEERKKKRYEVIKRGSMVREKWRAAIDAAN